MNKYNINENFFNEQNENWAYIVGFIASDGCITRAYNAIKGIAIHIKSTDYEILEKIKNHLEYDGPIIIKKHPPNDYNPNGSETASLIISRQQMAYDLIKLGIGPAKSFTLEYPNIPEEYDGAFLAGIVDGDGSWHFINNPHGKRKYLGFNITGPKEFLLVCQKKLNKIINAERGYIRDLHPKSGKPYHQLVYSGDDTLYRIADKLYFSRDSDLYLDRKFNIVRDYFNSLDKIIPQRKEVNHAPKSTELHLITAFGETKTLTEWGNDPRCVIESQTLRRRIITQKMEPEKAITEPEMTNHNNVAQGKQSNNQKVTNEQVKAVRAMHQGGMITRQIASLLQLKE